MFTLAALLRKHQKKTHPVRFVWLLDTLLILIVALVLFQVWKGPLLAQPRAQVAPSSMNSTPLFLVQTVNTALFSPASPDPSGITYLPQSGLLWISDSEVDELPAFFTGANLFGVTLSGVLSETKSTTSFSSEPTDLAYNPNNGHLFYSDDDVKKIFEVNPGADGIHGTGDDSVTSFSASAFGAVDPEGLSYDATSGDLFISSAVNTEVYRLTDGANGVFDGVPASGGDDVVTSFDTASFNLLDPQGIDFDPATGNLVMVGKDPKLIYEVTTSGSLVRTFDINVIGARNLASVIMAPGSKNPAVTNYYVVDRGVDNAYDPDENDGRIYEFTLDNSQPTSTPLPTNTPPAPTATRTPTNTPVTVGNTPTPTNTSAPSNGTATPTNTPTNTPRNTPINTPTNTPVPPDGTAVPTKTPGSNPTVVPDGDNEIFLPQVKS